MQISVDLRVGPGSPSHSVRPLHEYRRWVPVARRPFKVIEAVRVTASCSQSAAGGSESAQVTGCKLLAAASLKAQRAQCPEIRVSLGDAAANDRTPGPGRLFKLPGRVAGPCIGHTVTLTGRD